MNGQVNLEQTPDEYVNKLVSVFREVKRVLRYEERGFVDNRVFPCATLQYAKAGRIAIYYGAADSYVVLAFTTVDEIVNYIMKNHESVGDDQTIGRI